MAGTSINGSTTAADASVLLPIQNGLLANCRQQDVKFVQVQVSVDYSYSIRCVSPLRLDLCIKLPQGTSAMTNGGGVAYTLVTYAGLTDLWTLDTAQACSTIPGVTHQSAPGQLVQPEFGTTSATLNYNHLW